MAVRNRNTNRYTRSDRAAMPAKLSGKYMKDLLHVAAGGVGGLIRRAPVFARIHIGGIPVPPVVSGVGLLVWVVALGCLVQKLGQRRDVRRWAYHSRPGRRVVISWAIHVLPSGSVKEQNDP